MKKVLVIILPVLFIVACAFAFLGMLNTKFQEERLTNALERRSRVYAESNELAVQQILTTKNKKLADRQTITFQKKNITSGSIIYDNNGNIFSATPKISHIFHDDESNISYIKNIIQTKAPHARNIDSGGESYYSYLLPVYGADGKSLGAVEIISDKSFINNMLLGTWKRLAIVLSAMFLLICFVILILYRKFFINPVLQITKWFEDFQKGDPCVKIKDVGGNFKDLASEVEQTALKLKVAKKSVSEKAVNRLNKNELWTEGRLKDLVRAKIANNAFFVVSNREPYMNIKEGGKYKIVKPASGVVTALDPVLRACGGTWVAQASGNADKEFVNSKNMLGVPIGDEHYILKRVWLTKEEEEGFYYGYSNEGLWPLCHITHTRPVFREKDWAYYKEVNEKFADNLLEELPSDSVPYIFIQDYHFALLPKIIKDRRPDAVIAMFWHIPWPNPEVMSICPYLHEMIDGMLGCDLLGFHIQYYCNNFMDTANKFLESRVDYEKFSITKNNKETFVKAFPISVSYEEGRMAAVNKEMQSIKKAYSLYDKKIVISVERMDYTKGILEKLDAVDRFFELNPEHRKNVVFIQIASPSREAIQAYKDLKIAIDNKVAEINNKYSSGDYKVIIYFPKNFSADEIIPFYKLSDICIVSSLHDGMNLVAKEYVSLQSDNKGVLILSQFTGASKELGEALIINPYSIEEFADAIKKAVEMPEEEITARMSAMRKTVIENNVFKWAGDILSELTAISKKV